jgi:hypothetical protein
MKTQIFVNPINYSNPQLSPSVFRFDSPPFSRESLNLLRLSRRKWLQSPQPYRICSARASSASGSASYGGWDELRLVGDSESTGESDQFRHFLVSLKADDGKHIFVFLLGLVCALAISRVRVSSIVVFPASILVFAIGFSFGFVRGGNFSEVGVNGGKRRAKEEISWFYTEKLRNLVTFFDKFDVKVNNLKNDIAKAIDNKEITLGDLENYVNEMDSISLSALNARNLAEASMDNVGKSNVALVENQRSSRRKKELGEIGFELLQSVGSLFGENLVGSKPNKVKDNIKRETVESVVNDQTLANVSTSAVEESNFGSVIDNKGNGDLSVSQESSNKSAFDKAGGRRTINDSQSGKMSSGEMGGSAKRFIDGEEYSYRSNSLRFMNNQSFSVKTGRNNKTEMWESHDRLFNSEEFRVRMKHMGTEASFVQEQMLKKSSGAYQTSLNREKSNDKSYSFQFREEGMNHEDDSHMANDLSSHESEVGSSSSPKVSDDVVFDRYLTEANDLLKQAKEFMRRKRDQERAEIILYRSAKLLSKAIAMKPMSLLAVGQLGNTYLLHGELKLKISRELRTLLSGSEPLSIEKWNGMLKGLDARITSKDELAPVLVNVCEECEELLLEAGRKYRMALSIDGNDVRALYNWGIALSFRAQLIADIGPVSILRQ